MTQVWTVVSDAALTASVIFGVFQLLTTAPWDANLMAVIGLIIIGFAAVVGLPRFWLSEPPPSLTKFHRSLCWLAVTVGLTLIAVQMFDNQKMQDISVILLALCCMVLMVKILSDFRTSMSLSELSAAVSACCMLIISLLTSNTYGCLGSAILILTGLMVATRGRRLGMPSVDIFHYGLSLAILAFTRSLQAEYNKPYEADEA